MWLCCYIYKLNKRLEDQTHNRRGGGVDFSTFEESNRATQHKQFLVQRLSELWGPNLIKMCEVALVQELVTVLILMSYLLTSWKCLS